MSVADVSAESIASLVSLAGKTAVVTGGAQGLGYAIARRLAEAGASLLIADLHLDRAEAAAANLAREHGAEAVGVAMDVSLEPSVVAGAEAALRRLGGIDIWVNNAGIFPYSPLADLDVQTWDQVMGINLRGAFLALQLHF